MQLLPISQLLKHFAHLPLSAHIYLANQEWFNQVKDGKADLPVQDISKAKQQEFYDVKMRAGLRREVETSALKTDPTLKGKEKALQAAVDQTWQTEIAKLKPAEFKHTIQKGDTLSDILAKYLKTNVKDGESLSRKRGLIYLAVANLSNQGLNVDYIKEGDVVTITGKHITITSPSDAPEVRKPEFEGKPADTPEIKDIPLFPEAVADKDTPAATKTGAAAPAEAAVGVPENITDDEGYQKLKSAYERSLRDHTAALENTQQAAVDFRIKGGQAVDLDMAQFNPVPDESSIGKFGADLTTPPSALEEVTEIPSQYAADKADKITAMQEVVSKAITNLAHLTALHQAYEEALQRLELMKNTLSLQQYVTPISQDDNHTYNTKDITESLAKQNKTKQIYEKAQKKITTIRDDNNCTVTDTTTLDKLLQAKDVENNEFMGESASRAALAKKILDKCTQANIQPPQNAAELDVMFTGPEVGFDADKDDAGKSWGNDNARALGLIDTWITNKNRDLVGQLNSQHIIGTAPQNNDTSYKIVADTLFKDIGEKLTSITQEIEHLTKKQTAREAWNEAKYLGTLPAPEGQNYSLNITNNSIDLQEGSENKGHLPTPFRVSERDSDDVVLLSDNVRAYSETRTDAPPAGLRLVSNDLEITAHAGLDKDGQLVEIPPANPLALDLLTRTDFLSKFEKINRATVKDISLSSKDLAPAQSDKIKINVGLTPNEGDNTISSFELSLNDLDKTKVMELLDGSTVDQMLRIKYGIWPAKEAPPAAPAPDPAATTAEPAVAGTTPPAAQEAPPSGEVPPHLTSLLQNPDFIRALESIREQVGPKCSLVDHVTLQYEDTPEQTSFIFFGDQGRHLNLFKIDGNYTKEPNRIDPAQLLEQLKK